MPRQKKQSEQLMSVASSEYEESGSEYQDSESDVEIETDFGIENDTEIESDRDCYSTHIGAFLCRNRDVEEAAETWADITAADVEGQIRQFELAHKGISLTKPSQLKLDGLDDDSELFDGSVHPPEYYRRDMQDLDERAYLKRNHAEGTLDMVLSQNQGVGAIRGYETINSASVFAFMKWSLNQKKSPDGKLQLGTTKKASLITFWCDFRLAYQRAMGCKIDQAFNTQVISQGIAELNNCVQPVQQETG